MRVEDDANTRDETKRKPGYKTLDFIKVKTLAGIYHLILYLIFEVWHLKKSSTILGIFLDTL